MKEKLETMTYKNNYQRKQAVWREKWMKKEEKRQIQRDLRRLSTAMKNLASAAGEAITIVADAFGKTIEGLSEVVNTYVESQK